MIIEEMPKEALGWNRELENGGGTGTNAKVVYRIAKKKAKQIRDGEN